MRMHLLCPNPKWLELSLTSWMALGVCLSKLFKYTAKCEFILSLSLSRHFLFKTGTGTTPLFSTATPGYTMATGSVYSPPTRPLPRNTLSRSAFKFKKSSKYCSWRYDDFRSFKFMVPQCFISSLPSVAGHFGGLHFLKRRSACL